MENPIHTEVYILSRPRKFQYMPKEVYILPGPSKLQPVADYSIITQCTHREKDLPQLPSTLEAQDTHKEPATAVSQALIASCKRRVDQCKMVIKPRVYWRPRTMLKIRCTDVRQTRHNYSQSTESEKAKFQTPSTSNEARNYVEHNSVENISQDLVHRQILILLLLLSFQNQKKGRKLQKLQMYLHLHWRESRNSPTLQDPESQQERILEGQPVHIVTFTCK